MSLSTEEREAKLRKLAKSEGFETVDALLVECVRDSVNPGICVNAGCDYTSEVEPDQRRGYCEICGTQTIQAALVLARFL